MSNNPNLKALVEYLQATYSYLRTVEIKLEAAIMTAKGLNPGQTPDVPEPPASTGNVPQ